MSVFFTTPDQSKNVPDIDSTTHWDFDSAKPALADPDPFVAANGRRYASGFLAARVFEKPGTYVVKATRYYASGEKKEWTKQIKVLPLDAKWTTIYVALEGGADTGPSTTDVTLNKYDLPFKTTLQNAIEKLAKQYTRVRIRKPTDPKTPFQIEHGVVGGAPGPVLVDSYDPTAVANFYNKVPNAKVDDPNDPSTSDDTNAPTIQNTNTNSDWGTIGIGEDWRIMNLKVRAGGTRVASVGGIRDPGGVYFLKNNGLILRVEHFSMHGFWMSPGGHYNTVAESKFHNVSGTGYVGSDKMDDNTDGALIGNWVYNMTNDDPQHIFRLQSGKRYFIAFNEFGPDCHLNYDGLTIRGNTERVVIYRNILHDWLTGVWPQGRDLYDEKQRYVVLDSNLLIGVDHRNGGIAIRANDVVVRNNIIVNYDLGVSMGDDTVVGPSTNIRVHNNTFMSTDDPGSVYLTGLETMEGVTFEAYNNILWAGPKTTTSKFMAQILKTTAESDYWKTGRLSDYNLFFGSTAGWSGDGPTLFPSRKLKQWQSDFGLDTHSFIENPNFINVSLPTLPDFTPLVPPEDFAKPDGKAPHVTMCKALPHVALDFHGRLRTPGQCGAVAF